MPRRRSNSRIKNGKLQLYVRVHPGPGGLKTKTVERGSMTEAEIQNWENEQRKKFGKVRDAADGIAALAKIYLELKKTMPTIHKTTATLQLWIDELGPDTPPMSVTQNEITMIINRWMTTRATGRATLLTKSTIRRRRGILLNFYRTIFPNQPNPVTGSPHCRTPEPTDPYDLNFLDIEAAINAIPDRNRATHNGPCFAKIRLRCMVYAGLPPGTLAEILPNDLNLIRGTVIAGREKGAGVARRTLELSADALAAFKDFHAVNAYGKFNLAGTNMAFKRGWKNAGLPGNVWQYRLRHSFLTQHNRAQKDSNSTGRAALHAPGSKHTSRYTVSAHQEIDRAAADAFSESLARLRRENMKPAPNTAPAVPEGPRRVARTGRKSA